MQIYFDNKSKHACLCSVGGKQFVIPPMTNMPVDCADLNSLSISVKPEINKCCIKSFTKTKYYAAIESQYTFDNICDGDIFTVSYEKIRFSSLTVYYERFFISAGKAVLKAEKNEVSNKEEIESTYLKNKKHEKMRNLLWWEPVTSSLILGSFLIWIGVISTSEYGGMATAAFFLALYLFFVLAGYIGNFIGEKIFKNDAKEKSLLFNCLTDEFIRDYYSSPNRRPFDSEFETLESF